jgi:hypothetical protein
VAIAQIKVNTAEWLETQLHSEGSPSYLGENARTLLPLSDGREDLVKRLSVDSANLLYAAAYLAVMEKLWGETLLAAWFQNCRVGIIATLYSLGIVRADGEIRKPHDGAQMSEFGRKAQVFFDSFLLRVEFPE